jgi:hypothetical protein
VANSKSTAACNPSIVETREVVNKYINESEEVKNSGDGMRAIRRHGGTVLLVYGFKRKDFKKIRLLLAAEGIFVADMTHLKRCGFFTTFTTTRTIGNHPTAAVFRDIHGSRRPLYHPHRHPTGLRTMKETWIEAWTKMEKIPGAKAFLGGSLGGHTGFFNFHMARRSVDGREEPIPLYAAAAIMFGVGVIVGAHKTATIANAIQKKLGIVLQDEMEENEFTIKDWGVFYHDRAQNIEHVWYIGCSSTGVQTSGGGCENNERPRIHATAR